jgi:hypothetical protein
VTGACRMAKQRRTKYLLFIRLGATLSLAVFNRCTVRGFSSNVLSYLERERLEEELSEARNRGRSLSRLRQLTYRERVALEEREQMAQTRLRDHDAEHGCQR